MNANKHTLDDKITVRLTKENKAYLELIAKINGTTTSFVVNRAIDMFLNWVEGGAINGKENDETN